MFVCSGFPAGSRDHHGKMALLRRVCWFFVRLNEGSLYKWIRYVYSALRYGGVAEWLKATVLKTVDGKPFQSSNLCSSAIF